MKCVEIAGQGIGPGQACFVIAEAGVNHNGSLELARRLVDVAVEARADAVKFQTFRAEHVVSPQAPKADYQVETTGSGESQLEMVKRLQLPSETFRELAGYCRDRGILFLSTPFDEESVEFLDALGLPAFKVASGEVTNLPFLSLIARKGKPVILSTGMAYLGEVDEAVRTVRRAGNDDLILLHCVSSYPADPRDANLRAMRTLEAAFGTPVGFSDHTLGTEVAVGAVALGACVIEKHFTLDRALPGPDHRASLEPDELVRMVRAIRTVEAALGAGLKRPAPSEEGLRSVARRSLHLRVDVEAGMPLGREMLLALRPAGGILPGQVDIVVGRRLRRALRAGERLTWGDLV